MNNISDNLNTLRKEVWGVVQERIADLEELIKNSNLSGLDEIKAELDRLKKLPDDVSSLSEMIDALSEISSNLSNNLDGLTSSVESLLGTTDGLTSSVESLLSTTSGLTSSVETLTNAASSLQDGQAENKEKIENLTTESVKKFAFAEEALTNIDLNDLFSTLDKRWSIKSEAFKTAQNKPIEDTASESCFLECLSLSDCYLQNYYSSAGVFTRKAIKSGDGLAWSNWKKILGENVYLFDVPQNDVSGYYPFAEVKNFAGKGYELKVKLKIWSEQNLSLCGEFVVDYLISESAVINSSHTISSPYFLPISEVGLFKSKDSTSDILVFKIDNPSISRKVEIEVLEANGCQVKVIKPKIDVINGQTHSLFTRTIDHEAGNMSFKTDLAASADYSFGIKQSAIFSLGERVSGETLLFLSSDNMLYKITNTTKPYIAYSPIYYLKNGSFQSGAYLSTDLLIKDTVNAQNVFGKTFLGLSPLYLSGNLDGNEFTFDGQTTQTEFSNQKYYLYLGQIYGNQTLELDCVHPIYFCEDGKLKLHSKYVDLENVTNVPKILVNNSPITKTEDGNINIVVPTAIKDLTEDSQHQTVTDAEKEKWNTSQGGGNEEEIAEVQKKVINLESDVTSLNSQLNTLETNVNTLKTSVVDLSSDQTISGVKTFNKTPKVAGEDVAKISDVVTSYNNLTDKPIKSVSYDPNTYTLRIYI